MFLTKVLPTCAVYFLTGGSEIPITCSIPYLLGCHECPNWLSWISKKICTVYFWLLFWQNISTFNPKPDYIWPRPFPPLWFVYDLLMFIDVVIYLLLCVPGHPHDRPVLSPSLSLDSPFCVVLFSPFWKQETLSLCQVTRQFTSPQNGLPNPYESNPLYNNLVFQNPFGTDTFPEWLRFPVVFEFP